MPLRTPKRLQPVGNSDAHKRSTYQEREVAKRTGSRLTSGSGNQSVKGDCRKRGIVRIECKTTSSKSFTVTLDMLNKLETAANIAGEYPVLVVEFLRDGKPWRSVCITDDSLLDKIQQLDIL
jgi:Holliday junction resolvase